MMENDGKSSTEEQETCNSSLVKLCFDSIKQNDLKFMFEVLSVVPQQRTIADLDNLSKIMMHIEPIKKLANISAVFKLCRKMILAKYKIKDILYEGNERQQSLYILLSGKVAFYRKSFEYFESDEVIIVHPGTCFGKIYQWKINFIPICVEQSLFAVGTKVEVNNIPMLLSLEKQAMLRQLKNSDIFRNCSYSSNTLQQMSKMLTLNQIPCGSFIIRQGETPKALFYIMTGIIKKIICKNSTIIDVKRYSQSQYCPQQLDQPLGYDLIAQTSCQIIVIPKKLLRTFQSPLLICPQSTTVPININQQLSKKKEWAAIKQNLMAQYAHKFKQSNKKINKKWK